MNLTKKSIAANYLLQTNYGEHESAFSHIATEVVWHGFGTVGNLEGWKQIHKMYLGGFPDMRYSIDEQICEANVVVTRWTFRATHLGQWLGLEPTAKKVRISGAFIDHIQDGRVVEHWIYFDQLGLRQQLGMIASTNI